MKIDWKKLAKTDGYKSLKDCYARSIRQHKHTGLNKAKAQSHFYWIIGQAKHQSIKTGLSVEEILDHWESERTYFWISYYQSYQMNEKVKRKLKESVS